MFLRLLLIYMPKHAESKCRKVGKNLIRPALHAVIIHCGKKSARMAPPNTLTDTYIRFLPKTQPYINFFDSDAQIQTMFYYITEVDRLNTLVGSLFYFIILLDFTLLYYIIEQNTNKITLLSYTQSQHNV